MRKQIAAANWKMNLSLQEGEQLIEEITGASYHLKDNQEVMIAVPFPYLVPLKSKLDANTKMHITAQNVAEKASGAYTGEVSAAMLKSVGVHHVIIGHSERREYYGDTDAVVAAKIDRALEAGLTPIFCCGEPLQIREADEQNSYVVNQLLHGVFHLDETAFSKIFIAYEPIWAIGTGKTAGKEQAQEMHQAIRAAIANTYGASVADEISILYGGSVKADNAADLFSAADVDGGLVGGASLKAADFAAIINALA